MFLVAHYLDCNLILTVNPFQVYVSCSVRMRFLSVYSDLHLYDLNSSVFTYLVGYMAWHEYPYADMGVMRRQSLCYLLLENMGKSHIRRGPNEAAKAFRYVPK